MTVSQEAEAEVQGRGRAKGTTVVPALTGLALLEALQVSRASGLRVATGLWETKIGPWGSVLRQHPEAGSTARLGSRVQVVVATSPRVAVPVVAGLELDPAMERLMRSGLTIGGVAEHNSRSVPAGQVIRTLPAQGSMLVHRSPVTVVVSGQRPAKSGRTMRASGADPG